MLPDPSTIPPCFFSPVHYGLLIVLRIVPFISSRFVFRIKFLTFFLILKFFDDVCVLMNLDSHSLCSRRRATSGSSKSSSALVPWVFSTGRCSSSVPAPWSTAVAWFTTRWVGFVQHQTTFHQNTTRIVRSDNFLKPCQATQSSDIRAPGFYSDTATCSSLARCYSFSLAHGSNSTFFGLSGVRSPPRRPQRPPRTISYSTVAEEPSSRTGLGGPRRWWWRSRSGISPILAHEDTTKV
jgi:hypothetical protein